MIRLNMIVEGQTEETFAHDVLEEPLAQRAIYLSIRCVETSRDKRRHKIYRGGLLNYARARGRSLPLDERRSERRGLVHDDVRSVCVSPRRSPPGKRLSVCRRPDDRVRALQVAFAQDLGHPRFIPYIQLHEFEALLLTDPAKLDWEFIDHAVAIARGLSS